MRGGHNRKTRQQKEAEGTLNPSREAEYGEPLREPDPKDLIMPDYFTEAQKAVWDISIVRGAAAGLFDGSAQLTCEQYCKVTAELREDEWNPSQAQPAYFLKDDGTAFPNPWHDKFDKKMGRFMQLSEALGLTATGYIKVMSRKAGQQPKKGDDRFAGKTDKTAKGPVPVNL